MDLEELSWWKYILAKIVLRRADSVRVVSQKIKEQVEHIGVKAKISVLPVYVDISKFSGVVRRAHAGKNILWIGRFEEEKNPKLAIKVLKEVLQVEPTARLIMLGHGSEGKEIAKLAAGLPVELPGWQDPITFLEAADVVLCTSLHESWGASIVEALAAGVPVVAPDVGVAKEAGALVVPRDQLASAVVAVLREGTQGDLLLTMPTKEEWAKQWQKTL
jgi:glycosyltransferase involved in cell wall biosynthesis